MGRRYKSRQLLEFSGRIHVTIRITDHNGKWSFQDGVSYQGNVERSFKLGLSEAVTNALYKHFYRFGRPILKSEDVSLGDFIRDYELKDWYVLYITEDSKYTFKSTTRKTRIKNKNYVDSDGHYQTKRQYKNNRYLEIKYKDTVYSKSKTKFKSKKKVSDEIQGML